MLGVRLKFGMLYVLLILSVGFRFEDRLIPLLTKFIRSRNFLSVGFLRRFRFSQTFWSFGAWLKR